VPPPTTVRALIDTGSDLSVVHPQVLRQLGVQATGSIRIRRPGAVGGFRPASVSEVQLSIGGSSPGPAGMRRSDRPCRPFFDTFFSWAVY
jgi:predicted aspartyl protease